MKRRDILKLAASVTGSAILAPLSSSLLYGTVKSTATATTSNTPAFFDKELFSELTLIMDIILPRTDSPSASDVGVPSIMDNMFAKIFDAKYKNTFLTRFAVLQRYLSTQGFANASPSKQLNVLVQIENQLDKQTPLYQAYIDIKQQTVSYYLATEEVAENHLNYLPIPMKYIPRVSLKELGGKAWAE